MKLPRAISTACSNNLCLITLVAPGKSSVPPYVFCSLFSFCCKFFFTKKGRKAMICFSAFFIGQNILPVYVKPLFSLPSFLSRHRFWLPPCCLFPDERNEGKRRRMLVLRDLPSCPGAVVHRSNSLLAFCWKGLS